MHDNSYLQRKGVQGKCCCQGFRVWRWQESCWKHSAASNRLEYPNTRTYVHFSFAVALTFQIFSSGASLVEERSRNSSVYRLSLFTTRLDSKARSSFYLCKVICEKAINTGNTNCHFRFLCLHSQDPSQSHGEGDSVNERVC